MYHIKKTFVGTDSLCQDRVVYLGTALTEAAAIKMYRGYLKATNTRIMEQPYAPPAVRAASKRNVERNADLDITVDASGVVFVDGIGPEMDYVTITLV